MTREVWHAPNIPKKKERKKKFKSSPPSPLPHLIPSHPQKEKKMGLWGGCCPTSLVENDFYS